ncbi:MAG: hypothetical protein E6G56_01905 [Actinobacteria bacterium]|nr:MAG: hypothetical protein E6G56_01905 [Actinomycetota bacterium]
MSLVDKMKAQAEQAAAKTREGVGEIQAKRDLAQAEGELGRVAFDLADRGEIAHAQLTEPVQRIRDIKGRLAGEASSPTPAQ